MQHHVHAARAAPHLRPAPHHHSHMPPHPHPGMEQQQQQHLGTLTAAAATVATQQQQQQRLNHHHLQQQHHHAQQQQQQQQQQVPPQQQAPPLPLQQTNVAYINPNPNNGSSNNNNNNNNNQMQKIRQQHQHHNTANGHIVKQHQQQQQQQQAPPPPPPTHAYNQLPPNPAGGGATIAYTLPPHMAHLGGYAAPQPPTAAAVLSGKQTHYYIKPPKYNNNNNNNNGSNNNGCNNNNNNYAPKTILQNTYRTTKSGNGGQVVIAAPPAATVAGVAAGGGNNTTMEANTAIVVAAGADLAQLRLVDEHHHHHHQQQQQQPPPPATEAEEDNCELADEDCNSSNEQLDAAGNLPNEDGSASRGAKDKTPMCLVNELARYNKITHQYRLTSERGPAHCKTFTVTLKLGEEEYSADGFKIKKAQHLAASKAIEETKYKHPPPKIRRNDDATSSTRTHITPTVELNALAMKLGQRTYYLLDPTQVPPADSMLPPEYATPLLPTPAAGLPAPPPPPPPYALRRNGNAAAGYVLAAPPMHPHHPHVALPAQRGIYGPQRAYAPKYQSRFTMSPPMGPPHMLAGPHGPYAPALPVTPSKITLFVGKQKFVGIGRTLQQAKHDAAARALQVLKTQANNTTDDTLDDSMDEGDKKSPISQVHEIGIKRNMTVHFKVLREEGPAHMKNFITACIVGSIVTEGEGNGKKLSKKRAAEKMLTELHKLPPLTPTKQTPMKRIKVKTPGKAGAGGGGGGAANGTVPAVTPVGKPERRKRLGAGLKEKQPAVAMETDDAENPITKLIQLQQTRKEKEPIFELIAKNGNESSRRREFVMEVSASGSTARGTGNSKKLAKRNAAQALLELLEAASEPTSQAAVDNHVSTAEATTAAVLEVPMVSTPAGPVPGILILRQNKKPAKKKDTVLVVKATPDTGKEKETKTDMLEEHNSSNSNNNNNHSNKTHSSIESNSTEGSESQLNTSTGSNSSGVSSNSSAAGGAGGGGGGSSSNGGGGGGGGNCVHMKEQLIYLSKLLDFEVSFSDYPKGNHNEFLTIVTLSTTPPQICHGVGKSCEESQNAAARNALKILSELGLNNAKK